MSDDEPESLPLGDARKEINAHPRGQRRFGITLPTAIVGPIDKLSGTLLRPLRLGDERPGAWRSFPRNLALTLALTLAVTALGFFGVPARFQPYFILGWFAILFACLTAVFWEWIKLYERASGNVFPRSKRACLWVGLSLSSASLVSGFGLFVFRTAEELRLNNAGVAQAQPAKPAFSDLDFRCRNGRTSAQPQELYMISNDSLRMYYEHHLTQPFFGDMKHVEPSLSSISVATCTVTNYSQTPILNLQLAIAWEVARNNVAVTLQNSFPMYIDQPIEKGAPLAFRFANALPSNVVVIAPTTYCWVELPGDSDYEKCTLTRLPHLEAHDPTWKYLKDPPTWMSPNFVIHK
jgi:hypothetical protein